METFLAICAIAVLIYGIRYTRRKAIRLQDAAELRQSEERVKAQWVSVDMSEETTPPSEPLADETYTAQEPTIWDIEIEKYFSKESE
jgi:hypothetical protein